MVSIAVHPKPIVLGGGVFGEDGWQSTLLQMTSPIIGHHGNMDAYRINHDVKKFVYKVKIK